MKLPTLYRVVESVLESDVSARSNDGVLYSKVISFLGKQRGVDFSAISLVSFMTCLSGTTYPTYDTIGRLRRMVQANRSDLMGSNHTRKARAVHEEEVLKLVRDKKKTH